MAESGFSQNGNAKTMIELMSGSNNRIAMPYLCLETFKENHIHMRKNLLTSILSVMLCFNLSAQMCEGGFSDGNLCKDVNQYAFMPAESIGGGIMNDNWGWVSPETGREYALQGRSNGTSFIDVSDPFNPIYIGNLPTHDFEILWRDIKVYDNHAFIVAESAGHGMQVFDLMQLDAVTDPPVQFEESAHFPGFGNAHNIAINEATGFAYVVGSNLASGGLYMIDISDPLNPAPAGLFSEDGYTHDVQVVIYNGPDAGYAGHEVAFASNENTLTIVDVTDKPDPVMLSRTTYEGSAYSHQGWLTEDHRYFLLNDELDEGTFGHNTRTYVWDVESLENPELIGFFESDIASIDHNLYIKGNYCYQANYTGGLRVWELTDLANLNVEEVAYYDIIPEHNNVQFIGSWNAYPFFPSGTIILSNMYVGLHILEPDFEVVTTTISQNEKLPLQLYPNPARDHVRIASIPADAELLEIYDLTGKQVWSKASNWDDHGVLVDTSGFPKGLYVVKAGASTARLIIQ
jgi:choice-of-anchor B domain-containing protein